MKSKHGVAGNCGMRCIVMFAFLTLALTLFAQTMKAQTADSNHSETQSNSKTYRTFYLTNVTETHDAPDVLTDLRNMLPRAKLYYVPSQNAISMLGAPDDFLLAQKILSDMDRARKIYRLTYTITDTGNGAHMGARHVSFVVASGGRSNFKEGSRVPVAVGGAGNMQYLDIGLTIEASVDGLRLHSRVEQSSVTGQKSGAGAQDPVVRQSTLEGMSNLEQDKAVVLGSLDLAGGNRREKIAVRSELVQ